MEKDKRESIVFRDDIERIAWAFFATIGEQSGRYDKDEFGIHSELAAAALYVDADHLIFEMRARMGGIENG